MLGPARIADTSPMTRASKAVGAGASAAKASVGALSASSSPGQHLDQPVLEARALVEPGHALVVGPGERRGLGNRLVEPAELVDQSQLPRRAAVPHPALGEAIDVGDAFVARCRDDAEEAAVDAVDAGLDQRPGRGRGR